MKKPTSAPSLIDFNGLPAVCLEADGGARAVVTLHGAHLVSWLPAGSGERLYLSERSSYAAGRAIRGGIPVIFPQFSDDGPLPRHGFARTSEWTLANTRQGEGFAVATFSLSDSETTRAVWPHAFLAELTVMIEGKRLDVELEVTNTGTDAFSFQSALHSYFNVARVDMCQLQGLEGTRYTDRRDGGRSGVENAETLSFEEEVDRIHFNVGKPLLLWEPARSLAIESDGFRDVVVWNPGKEKCAALDDMPADGYRRMLCVEAANVGDALVLPPDESWYGRQTAIAL